MTSTYLTADLKRDEGFRALAYPDPLTGGDPWTIGWGHTGREVHSGLRWSIEYAESVLAFDVAAVKRGLDTSLPWWRTLDDLRQDVMVNIAFNAGVSGLMGFHRMLAAAQHQQWDVAEEEILNSKSGRELPTRYGRLAEQMRTGLHQ